MSRLRVAAAIVLSTGVLTACGGGEESSSSSSSSSAEDTSSSAAPATGDEISGEGFTFNAPDDWEQNDGSDVPSINFLAIAVDPDDKDGFADNVNVVADPTLTQVDDVEQLGEAVEKVLTGVAKDVKLQEPSTVDGEDAAVATATFTQGSTSYKTLQYAVTHDDEGYVITFSFSEDKPAAEQKEIAESVVASWAWAA